MALTDSLVSYWKLDEASGNATDAHGSNTLTDNGSVGTTTGKISNARDFGTGGSTKYFDHASNSDLETGDIDFTVAAWVYLTASSKGYATITGKVVSDGATAEWFLIRRGSVDQFEFQVAGTTHIRATTFGSPSTGTWYYVIAWHDATANTINIQVNNGTVDSTADATITVRPTAKFAVGTLGSYTDGNSVWDGYIDEVGFWKRVLTTQERTDLYNSGNGLAYPFASGPTYTLACDAGSYSVTGTSAALKHAWKTAPTPGSYAVTGTAAALKHASVITATPGSYTANGTTLHLAHGWKAAAAVGSYTVTGNDVTLTPAQGPTHTLTASAGSYGVTGTAAAITHGWKTAPTPGSYTLTGTSAGLHRGYTLALTPGSYSVTGTAATFHRTFVLTVTAGSYAVLGSSVTLTWSGEIIQVPPRLIVRVNFISAVVCRVNLPGSVTSRVDFQRVS